MGRGIVRLGYLECRFLAVYFSRIIGRYRPEQDLQPTTFLQEEAADRKAVLKRILTRLAVSLRRQHTELGSCRFILFTPEQSCCSPSILTNHGEKFKISTLTT